MKNHFVATSLLFFFVIHRNIRHKGFSDISFNDA